jgi:hypothetical protein
MSSKRALLIGFNYPGSSCPLSGCINDVVNAAEVYTARGYSCEQLTDANGRPTPADVLGAMRRLVDSAVAGDQLVLHFSGHGGSLPDRDGDELDRTDECIFAADLQPMSDDLLRKTLVDPLPAGVSLRCMFDCCHSGTGLDLPYKYYSGKTFTREAAESPADVIMISGCKDSQTSADAWIAESKSSQGAMTWAWIKALKKIGSGGNWLDLLRVMRGYLTVGGYDQVPQLTATHKNLGLLDY